MYTIRRAGLAVCFSLAAVISARAQIVRGVIAGPGEKPLSGVVVMLLDSTSRVVNRSLSNVEGAYRLTAPASGHYRIRTLRIGYQPVVTGAFSLDAGQTLERRVVLSSVAFALENVRVSGRSVCRPIGSDSATATLAVWEQARIALNATELTAALGTVEVTTISYQRLLDRSMQQVKAQRAEMRTALVRQPWQSVSPDSLHENGYVITGADDSVTYAAPGLDALLSESFILDHCFTLVTGQRGWIGVAFEPNSDRRRIAEIRGTLWLDRKTAELTRLEFTFANLPRMLAAQAGGEMNFVRTRDGSWLIPRWNIRMPVIGSFGYRDSTKMRLAAVKVAGGEVSLAVRKTDTLWSHPPMQLVGLVSDSATGAPVANVSVVLRGTPYTATTSSTGAYVITGLLPGNYTIDAHGAGRTYFGSTKSLPVTVIDSTDRGDFILQNAAEISKVLCGTAKWATSVSYDGVLTGVVDTSEARVPRSTIVVTADWIDVHLYISRNGIRSLKYPIHQVATVDERGAYHFCPMPLHTDITVSAFAADVRALPVVVRIADSLRFGRADVTLDGELLPVATFAGSIVRDSLGTPASGVDVMIADMELAGVTNSAGRFSITEITGGLHKISVRGDGYVPFDTTMVFTPNKTERTQLTVRRIAGADTSDTDFPSGVSVFPAPGQRVQRTSDDEYNRQDLPLVGLHRRKQGGEAHDGHDRNQ